jgi:hypothetical protein
MNLNKIFSFSHYDSWSHPSLYYEAMKNSPQQFRDEIYDIYFGKIFRYNHQEHEFYDNDAKHHEVVYGNVMGVEASDEQVDNLFRIQVELGIEISPTINQLNIPVEIFFSKNNVVIHAFLDWLQKYYDRGLRSCTLANNHLMKAGMLQDKFPEMKWKNTVNQRVSSAQEVLDYLYLGYNVIQLDRSLNRDLNELKRIKDVVERYKSKYPKKYVKTSMLVREGCMPFCPFKKEHDDLQSYHKKIDYWSSYLLELSCGKRENVLGKAFIPRSGTDCFWISVDTFKEYAEFVDIFKFSGRLRKYLPPQDSGGVQFGWYSGNHAVNSFKEIVENRLEPVFSWFLGTTKFQRTEIDFEEVKKDLDLKMYYFMKDEAKKLEQRVKNCKNQCYNCHLCERTFKLPEFDSLVEF